MTKEEFLERVTAEQEFGNTISRYGVTVLAIARAEGLLGQALATTPQPEQENWLAKLRAADTSVMKNSWLQQGLGILEAVGFANEGDPIIEVFLDGLFYCS